MDGRSPRGSAHQRKPRKGLAVLCALLLVIASLVLAPIAIAGHGGGNGNAGGSPGNSGGNSGSAAGGQGNGQGGSGAGHGGDPGPAGGQGGATPAAAPAAPAAPAAGSQGKSSGTSAKSTAGTGGSGAGHASNGSSTASTGSSQSSSTSKSGTSKGTGSTSSGSAGNGSTSSGSVSNAGTGGTPTASSSTATPTPSTPATNPSSSNTSTKRPSHPRQQRRSATTRRTTTQSSTPAAATPSPAVAVPAPTIFGAPTFLAPPGTPGTTPAGGRAPASQPTSGRGNGGAGGIGTAPGTLARDINKIVRVVPLWAWVLLGTLAAFGFLSATLAAAFARRARYADALVGRIRTAAITDPLTGLLNRRGFAEALELEIARARRFEHPLAVAFLDVRGLKAVNDDFGHQAGDDLLKAVGGLLRRTSRQADIVARVGGDECAVALIEQDRAGAVAFARRIAAEVPHARAELGVLADWDLTVGVAVFPDDGETGEELLAAADRRLYMRRGIALQPGRS
jgi:diguanylate cyclase (GGDEF)-like protein